MESADHPCYGCGMTPKPKPDDKAQSKRFLEVAREIGAAEDDSRADEVMGNLAKQPPEPRKPQKR